MVSRVTGLAIAVAVVLAGCSPKADNSSVKLSLPNTSAPYLGASGANVMAVHIGGDGLCGKNGYQNEPCASVQICVPGTTQCQTIPDVLIDTGSIGLRLFSSAVTLTLPSRNTADGKQLAQCAQFGTGSTWGSVVAADVILGGEPAVTSTIQLVDKSYGQVPQGCSSADSDPKKMGYNGILGLGYFKQDCGDVCATVAGNGEYFKCDSGGTCAGAAVANEQQVSNIVARLPVDNNGVLLALPQIKTSGEMAVQGALILGVGTQSNNATGGLTAYTVDHRGNFTTTYQGQSYPKSFIDSGSNGLFFPNVGGIPTCATATVGAQFYCPDELKSLLATNIAIGGGLQTQVGFLVGNAATLAATHSVAFNDMTGVNSDAFDWGLPFFYGRAVVIGIEGRTSSLGTGPYVGY